MKPMKRLCALLFAVMMMTVCTVIPANAAYSKTEYSGITVDSSTRWPMRYKYVTTVYSDKTTYTKKEKVGILQNTSSKAGKKSLSYQSKTERSYSLGADIPLSILRSNVKAHLGGEVKYTQSVTVSISNTIPAYSTQNVYLQFQVRTVKYKHVKQKQVRAPGSNTFQNSGNAKTSYSTVTTRVPKLIL